VLYYDKKKDAISAVRRGMERWVQEFIVAQKICPFAATSAYDFHIYVGKEVTADMFDFFFKAKVMETGRDRKEPYRYNSFLVFPFIQDFNMDDGSSTTKGGDNFMEFFHVAIEHCEGYVATLKMDVQIPSSQHKVIAVPFHPLLPKRNLKLFEQNPFMPKPDYVTEERLYTSAAPLPTVHLLRNEDLTAVRDDEDKISASIIERNHDTMRRIGLTRLREMMEDYESEIDKTKSPSDAIENDSVIQVLEPLSSEEMAKLQKRGISVEVIGRETPKSESKPLIIRPNKKNKRKRKK